MIANMRTGTGIEYYRKLQETKIPYNVECWNKECRFEQCTKENRCLDWPIGLPPDTPEPSKMVDPNFGICVCGHGRSQHDSELPASCFYCACLAFNRRSENAEFRPGYYLPIPIPEPDLEPLPEPISIWNDRHPAWTKIAKEATTPIYDRIMARLDAIRPTVTITLTPRQLRKENARKIHAMVGAPIGRNNGN